MKFQLNLHQMNLFLNIFNLNLHISILAYSLANLASILLFSFGFLHEQFSILEFKINHVFAKNVIIPDFRLHFVDFLLKLMDYLILGTSKVLVFLVVLERR